MTGSLRHSSARRRNTVQGLGFGYPKASSKSMAAVSRSARPRADQLEQSLRLCLRGFNNREPRAAPQTDPTNLSYIRFLQFDSHPRFSSDVTKGDRRVRVVEQPCSEYLTPKPHGRVVRCTPTRAKQVVNPGDTRSSDCVRRMRRRAVEQQFLNLERSFDGGAYDCTYRAALICNCWNNCHSDMDLD